MGGGGGGGGGGFIIYFWLSKNKKISGKVLLEHKGKMEISGGSHFFFGKNR